MEAIVVSVLLIILGILIGLGGCWCTYVDDSKKDKFFPGVKVLLGFLPLGMWILSAPFLKQNPVPFASQHFISLVMVPAVITCVCLAMYHYVKFGYVFHPGS